MFRNVRFYSLLGGWPEAEQQLSDQLARAEFTPCGPLTERSSGWEAPTGEAGAAFARRVGGADMLRLRTQLRVLPPAAIDEALEARLADYRARTREEPTRRVRRQLKEQTRDELLPKALLRSERIRGFCILDRRVIGIEAAAESRAERFVDHLRAPLGGLQVKPLAFKRPVGQLLTQILLGPAPPSFSAGRECRLRDPTDQKASARFADMDLGNSAVRKCVKDGMEITHLAVEFANVVSCVVDANGVIGKLRFVGSDAPGADGEEDPLGRFDAQCALLTGTLRQLLQSLERLLGAADD